ncbi:MAG: FG-GAP repeat protein, partial [Candidimonas sp.]
IGARGIDNGISNQGAVFAFNKIGGTWSQTQTIISSVPFSGGEFGVSVDMSGNYAVVGAWREDNSNGVAYVYEYSNNQWNLMNRLLAPEFISGQRFGTSVAIDGNTIAIGAAYSGIGRAYVYRRNGQSWEYQDTLAANNVDGTIVDPSASSNDGQGISVGVDESNNVILVSAHRNNSTGTVYVYENVNNTWSPSAIQPISKINGNPSSSNDFFGLPVSIFNGNVIVGASRRDSSSLSDNGFVYFFKSN